MADADTLREPASGIIPSDPAPPTGDAGMPEGSVMSLVDHLSELRDRLVKCIVVIAIGTAIGFYFAPIVRNFLLEPLPNGQARVAFRLWDVFGGQQMEGQAYTTQPENWRRVAHIIADAIYTAVTGETGYFDTRIVYIAESGPALKRIKRLLHETKKEHGHLVTDLKEKWTGNTV